MSDESRPFLLSYAPASRESRFQLGDGGDDFILGGGTTQEEEAEEYSRYRKVVWPAAMASATQVSNRPDSAADYHAGRRNEKAFHYQQSGVDRPMGWMRSVATAATAAMAATDPDKEWEMEIAKRAWDAKMSHRTASRRMASVGGPGSVRERAKSFERRGEGALSSSSVPNSRMASPHRNKLARSSSTADKYWREAMEEKEKGGGKANYATIYGGKDRSYQPQLQSRHEDQSNSQQQLQYKNLSKAQILEQWVRQASSSQDSGEGTQQQQEVQLTNTLPSPTITFHDLNSLFLFSR